MTFFNESFSSALAYMSQPYTEAMTMHICVTYTPCTTLSMEKIGDIIMFAQFEEENILSETRNNTKSGDKSDKNLNITTLLREEEIDAIYSGNGSDDDPMSTDMLEEILTEVSPIRTLIGEKHVIKYVIVL